MEIKFNLDKDLIIFDVETTGVTPLSSGIIQLSACKFDVADLTISTDVFDVYIKPYVEEWTEESESVHRISREFLEQNGITLNRALKQFVSWIGPYPKKFYLAQWGCGFDTSILKYGFDRTDLKFPFTHRSYDIASIVRFYLAIHGISPGSLKECAQVLNVPTEEVTIHNAKDDTLLTAHTFRKVIEHGFSKKNNQIKQT